MKYNISTRKIEIRVDESDVDLKNSYYKKMRDVNYFSYKYANEIIRLNLFKDILKDGLKTKEDSLSSKELSKILSEKVFGCSERNIGYKYISKDYKDELPSGIRTSINSLVYAAYNNDKSETLKGDKSIRSYRRNMPTPFQKDMIRNLKTSSNDKNFTFDFYSIPLITNLGRDRSNNKIIVENIIKGEYLLCDSSYQFKNNKLFLLLVFKSPVIDFELNVDNVVGVDLGINIPLYMAMNNSLERCGLGDRDSFLNKRLVFQKRRKSLQSSLTLTRGGKGRKKKLKALDSLRDKERLFARNYNHNLSKKLIDFALKNNCGIINIENLKGIDSGKFILRNWSYFELQNMIKQKAKKVNIVVNVIDAKYSSQKCHKCHNISGGNRKSQKDFECDICGYTDNADYNAAKNISVAHTKEYQDLIKKYTNSLKLVKVL